jgi:dATP pyrophosphohydrolase
MPGFESKTIQVHIASFFPEYDVYKFLLLKRAGNLKKYPNIWQSITGNIEINETALQAALRETIEETGLKPLKSWTIPFVTMFFDPKNDIINASPVFGFLVDNNSVIELSEEHVDYGWFYLDSCIDKLVLPSHKQASEIFYNFCLTSEFGSLYEIQDF